MTFYDFLLGLLIAFAGWRGYQRGFILGVSSLVGAFLGIWLGLLFGDKLQEEFGWDKHGIMGTFLVFLIIFFATLVASGVVSLLFRGISRLFALGWVDSLLGALLSLVSSATILGVCLHFSRNSWVGFVRGRYINKLADWGGIVSNYLGF